MDYGVKKGNYLGHGSNLVYTTDGLDMMRSMDSDVYKRQVTGSFSIKNDIL